MNRIQISGNLTKDAEKKMTKDNKEFVTFSVAVNDYYKEKETTTFYSVTTSVTGVFDYLKQGKKVFVEGTPYARAYKNEKTGDLMAEMCIRNAHIELGWNRQDEPIERLLERELAWMDKLCEKGVFTKTELSE